MKKSFKNLGILLLAAILGFGMVSCSKDEPNNNETVKPEKPEKPVEQKIELKSIKIINAGPKEDQVINGKIDGLNITFEQRLDPASKFDAIKFEIEANEGTKLEKDSYDFSMEPEETEKKITITLVNGKRSKSYFCTVGKLVPVFGANFDQKKIYQIGKDDIPFPSCKWGAFDGKYAALSSPSGVAVISLEDVLAGKKGFKNLNLEGLDNGIFKTCCVQLHKGHIYVANLAKDDAANPQQNPFKVYYYETPDSKAEVIASVTLTEGNRYGDNFSLELDEDGNGFMFFIANNQKNVMRFTVKNGKTVDKDPVIIPISIKNSYFYDTITKMDGTENYIYSGSGALQQIVDSNMKPADPNFTTFSNIGEMAELNSIRIIDFNKERYMLGIQVGRNDKVLPNCELKLFNITKGADPMEALNEFFNQKDKSPIILEKVAGNQGGTAYAAADYYIEKDNAGKDSKLYLFGSSQKEGFIIIEAPVKKAE